MSAQVQFNGVGGRTEKGGAFDPTSTKLDEWRRKHVPVPDQNGAAEGGTKLWPAVVRKESLQSN